MNERINYLKTYILDKRHHSQRRTPSSIGLDKLNTIYAQQGLSPVERATACFAALMNAELPVILPGEKIVFTRTLTQVPDIYTPEEWNEIKTNITSTKKVRYVISPQLRLYHSTRTGSEKTGDPKASGKSLLK